MSDDDVFMDKKAKEAKLGGHKSPGSSPLGSKKRQSAKAQVNDHERELAEKLDGRRQPLSGALDGHKGDIKLEAFLFDSKETKSGSILLTGKDLTKITREADGERRLPGLVVTIEQVPDTVSKEWVLIPLNVFSEMVERGQADDLES